MRCKILVKNAIKCKKCGDIIESKYTHNFVVCSCGCCAVDGGLSYLRRCGEMSDWVDLSEYKEIDVYPKYEKGDRVCFKHLFEETKVGVIQTVDSYPYSYNNFEYDIWAEEENVLYKHVVEKMIIGKEEAI